MINSIATSALTASQVELFNTILMEDPNLPTEDALGLISYYSNQDVNSVKEYEHHCLSGEHYEFFRTVYGFKPYDFDYASMSSAQLEAEIDKMKIDLQQQTKAEKEAQEEYSRFIQARKAKNAYKPNLAFGNLKELIFS